MLGYICYQISILLEIAMSGCTRLTVKVFSLPPWMHRKIFYCLYYSTCLLHLVVNIHGNQKTVIK